MSLSRKALYAMVAVLLVLAALEGGLRLAGFRYLRVTTDMEFNYPRPGFIKAFFEIDKDLLYRIRPTVKQRFLDLTWQPRFDLKIRDSRTFGPKPPGTARVIVLGDSSTYGVNTRRPWPRRLQERLDSRAGQGRFQVVNLGVPGYTAFQGRRVLETRGQLLEPDAIVIYFGWNDHLLALGRADEDQEVGGATVVSVRNTLARSRIYQALSWLVAAARSWGGGEGTAAGEPLRRVGPDAFRDELNRLADIANNLGAVPILCTYPTAFSVLAREGIPAPDWLPLTHAGPGSDLDDVLRLQERYNDTVRAVAAERGIELVDLDSLFAGGDLEVLFDAPDGDLIHPADAGYDQVAARVHQALLSASGR
jgi:lysophospholipase L1-like esterase